MIEYANEDCITEFLHVLKIMLSLLTLVKYECKCTWNTFTSPALGTKTNKDTNNHHSMLAIY